MHIDSYIDQAETEIRNQVRLLYSLPKDFSDADLSKYIIVCNLYVAPEYLHSEHLHSDSIDSLLSSIAHFLRVELYRKSTHSITDLENLKIKINVKRSEHDRREFLPNDLTYDFIRKEDLGGDISSVSTIRDIRIKPYIGKMTSHSGMTRNPIASKRTHFTSIEQVKASPLSVFDDPELYSHIYGLREKEETRLKKANRRFWMNFPAMIIATAFLAVPLLTPLGYITYVVIILKSIVDLLDRFDSRGNIEALSSRLEGGNPLRLSLEQITLAMSPGDKLIRGHSVFTKEEDGTVSMKRC